MDRNKKLFISLNLRNNIYINIKNNYCYISNSNNCNIFNHIIMKKNILKY